MKTPELPEISQPDEQMLRQFMRKHTRRSFLVGLLSAGGAYAGWHWLTSRPQADGVAWPFRKVLEFNEKVSGKLFNPNRHIIEIAADAIPGDGPRVNGDIGLPSFYANQWRLKITGTDLAFTLDDLKTLPLVTQSTPLNCIEGWTTAARWTGVRFSDFVEKFYPAGRSMPFVGLATPDGEYYVGLDAASAFHPQTLLCHTINDKPLSFEHGNPLRLLIPTKYGIKNLKRVGTITFADTRLPDYWAQQGYDWFAGF